MIKYLFDMKMILCSKVRLLLLLTILSDSIYATDYYVAKTGNDSTNTGLSISSPFLTIQKAADVAISGDIINVRAGIYRESINMKADGIIYRPYNSESVTINGTDLLTAWTQVSGSSTYSTTMNWNVDSVWGTNQVFADGTMIELARWPNQTSSDIIMPTNAKANGVTASGFNFTINDLDFNEPAARWVGAKIWINLARNGKDGQGWTGTVLAVSGNNITANFGDNPRLGDEPWSMGENTEYFLFDPTPAGVNASGGVDALLNNGEWWKDGNTLYVKTPNGASPNTSGSGTNIIEAKRRHFAFWASSNKANYTIKDFNLFACSITTDNNATNNRGIEEAAHDITIEGLNVLYPSHQTDMTGNWQDQHYTWTGIVVSGRNNTLKDCIIRYAATSAVSIQGYNIKVLNNKIQDANYMCSNSGALNTGFFCKDAEIADNEIWNTTQMAINFRYSQNSNPSVKNVFRIHHNKIYNFIRRSGDSGGIDVFGQDLQWARIDHNLIYNTLDDAKYGDLKHGVYLDFGGGDRKIRVTIDHNIMYGITTPILINNGTDVDVYNNVLLTHEDGPNAQFAIGNFNGGTGERIKIYNNIMSHPGNTTGCCGDLSTSDFRNNITNARDSVLTSLFVDAANGNFSLKSTATTAIDKGISVGEYDDNVQGIADLGAIEWGTFLGSADTIAPSVPISGFAVSNLTSSGFSLSWTASTDNIAVTSYDVYANGLFIVNTPNAFVSLTNLTSSTTYFITLKAVDATGNRSDFSAPYEVKTVLNDVFITAASSVPVIDGTRESTWSGAIIPLGVSLIGTPDSTDLSGSWTSLWDSNNLYLFIDVKDDNKTVNSGSAWYDDDRIEIFIDADNNKGDSYGVRDYQYYIRPGETTIGEIHYNATSNVQLSNVNTSDGYKLEIKIPFATLGITPAAFKYLGIDVQVSDDDGAGTDAKKAWYSKVDRTYQDPSLMGTAQLKNSGAADTITPSIPVSLQASGVTTNSFTLSWRASSDNIGVGFYEVFKNGNLIKTVSDTSYTITELDPITSYSMSVKAKDQSGNLSAASSILKVTTFALGSETKYEAEDATLGGDAEVESNHSGFSGTAFVGGYGTQGASTTFTVNVPNTTIYDILLGYANNFGSSQTVSIYVNGVKIKQTALSATGSWSSWATKSESLSLVAGNNTIKYQYDAGDGGNVNLDYISLYALSGEDSEAPDAPTNLQASSITSVGFTLNWSASTDNVGVTGYEIFKNGISVGTASSTTFNLSGLIAATAYNITVKARDAIGSWSDASGTLIVTTLGNGPNLALSGIGYRWSQNIASAFENTNRVEAPGLNDEDTDSDVSLNNGVDDLGNAYEAAGIIWSSAPSSISTVKFKQGSVDVDGNTCFTANLSLQFTTNGTTWTESGWSITPSYPYTNDAAGNYYTFSGTPVTGILGVRVNGQVHTNIISWRANIKEVEVYTTAAPDTTAPSIPTGLNATSITTSSFTLNWTASTDNSGVSPTYDVFNGSTLVGNTAGLSMNISGLSSNTSYSMTVKARDNANPNNVSSASNSLAVVTDGSSGGTAYYWRNLSTSTSNSGRTSDSRINDGNTTLEVVVPDASTPNYWQAAGMIWSSTKSNITKIEYYNGYQTNNGLDNGCFTANIKVQYTTSGNGTWIDASGWSISPSYPYNYTASNQMYTFTGSALPSNTRGVRIVGQVYTNNISWAIHVREIKVFNSSNLLLSKGESDLFPDQILSPNLMTTVYPNPVNDGWVNISIHEPPGNDPLVVTLTDLNGKLIRSQNVVHTGQIIRLNIGQLITGIYFIKITGKKTNYSSKLIVK